MHYTGESVEQLEQELHEKFRKAKLPEYKILSIKKVADSLEQFRLFTTSDETPRVLN